MDERDEMIRRAVDRHRERWGRAVILYPEKAIVTYPEFNPFRAVQTIARVEVPAILHCRQFTAVHHVTEEDA